MICIDEGGKGGFIKCDWQGRGALQDSAKAVHRPLQPPVPHLGAVRLVRGAQAHKALGGQLLHQAAAGQQHGLRAGGGGARVVKWATGGFR
jgi:hypothetical protein